MKLREGIKLKGTGVEIPDCGRNDLPVFFKEKGYKVGVEVGVYKGDFTKKFLEAGLKMFGVDPWKAYSDYEEIKRVSGKPYFQERQDFLYGHTQRTLNQWLKSGECTLIRESSVEGAKLFKDESLDFVYIDGHHGLKFVIEDIFEWSKKVKKGGIVAGHDYANGLKPANDPYVCHVKIGVDACTQAFGIKNWFILGSKEKKEGEIRDNWRSWMWIKE